MVGLNLIYLIIIWIWQPYNKAVNFHNKALRFNHITSLLLSLSC